VAYTVLLGVVLPFICWGTLATPGHPHRMAHIVFFLPSMRAEIPALGNDTDHAGHLQHQMQGDQDSSAAQPVGRSVPDELASAISIISPLLVVQILLVFSPTREILRLGHTNTSHLFDPRVLTPPPRRLYL
jgi:hypothetical protein